MKTILVLACLCLFMGGRIQGQDSEWNTYSGELHEYQFKYPENWTNGSGDKEKAASMALVFDPLGDGTTGVIVMTMRCAFALGKDMGAHESVLKKTAKKASDSYFKVTGEGDMKFGGEKCQWIEYTQTQTLENGTQNKQTVRDYLFHHRNKGAFYSDLFTFKVYANTDNWATAQATFDKIRDSFQFLETK